MLEKLHSAPLLLFLLIPLQCLAQNSAKSEMSDSVYTLQVYNDLVLVNVSISDKHGKPIRNLHREDFKLTEDRVPQKISTFDFEDLSTPLPAVTPETRVNFSALSREAPPKELLRNRRLMILMLDLSSMPAEDQIAAQKAAQTFIENQMASSDLLAVVSHSSNPKLLQNFTNDRELLIKATRQFTIGESSDLAIKGNGDPDSPDSVIEDQSTSFVADETQFNIFNTDQKLAAIESVGKMFASLPEKKFLIYFSSGVETTGTENQAQIRSTINALNQANTSLYAVDARGLIAPPPGGDASHGSTAGTANYNGQAVRSQMDSISGSQETLTTLAMDTGGRALLDNNNLGKVFDAVTEDSGSYYLLGYYSSNTKRDGKFRQIRVQVNLPGTKVRARLGYYAPKSFEQFTKSDKERQLEEAISTERPFSEVPFLVSTNFIRSSDDRVFVPIGLQFAAADIPFADSKKSQVEFDFIGQVRRPDGNVVSAVRDTVRVQLTPTVQGVKGSALQYLSGFFLKAGNYQLKFLLRENRTGKLSTFEQALNVPDFLTPKLSMSSIVLSNHLEPVSSKRKDQAVKSISGTLLESDNDPLRVDDARVVPSITRVFSRNDTLYILFQSYFNEKRNSPALSQEVEFLRDGKPFRKAARIEVDQFDSNSRNAATSHFAIPLDGFTPGSYDLQVAVSDHASHQSLTRRVNFVVR